MIRVPSTNRCRDRAPRLYLAFILTVLAGLHPAAAAGDPPGKAIFAAKCASCHGTKGEGNPKEYAQPLAGDRSIRELSKYIDDTMPKDSPEDCSSEEARQVAEWIHGEFYSRIAQARNQPARIELTRLTVKQYRNVLADLIGSFRGTPGRTDKRGLRAEYFKTPRLRRDQKAIERVDAVVDFQWKDSSPDPAKVPPKEFSAKWQGSVIAPESGLFEIVVRTENGFRLWLNSDDKPVIDGWVKSGSDREFKTQIRLLGGRSYPLRLEWFKAKEEKTASIALLWKAPHRALEPIPERCLTPNGQREVFVTAAAFPPDDRSTGYERGTSISKAWDSGTTDGAIETADYVIEHLSELSGSKPDQKDFKDKLKAFCRIFAERALRGALNDDLRKQIVDASFEKSSDAETAVRRCVLVTLKSPQFLYTNLRAAGDARETANRLALTLWDSLPDEELLKAAAQNKLSKPDEIEAQAERMLTDPRARWKVREFFHQWLTVDHFHEVAKDPQVVNGFDEAVVSDLRTSLDLFLDDVLWGQSPDFRRLLEADFVYLNGRLAKIYGAPLKPEAVFQKVTIDGGRRAGVLSHPYLMAGLSYRSTTSPIHRGVFVARSVLGRILRPPPEAVAPLAPELKPELSTRERVALQTREGACMSCHGMINPLGFSFEEFDVVGRYRNSEKGRSVDPSGEYMTTTGDSVRFKGVRELARFLATSPETHAAFVEQLFHHEVKQPIRAWGLTKTDEFVREFQKDGFNVRRLLVRIAATAARPPERVRNVASSVIPAKAGIQRGETTRAKAEQSPVIPAQAGIQRGAKGVR